MKTRKVSDKRYNLLRHAEDVSDNHHYRLNITVDKSTSLELRKMGSKPFLPFFWQTAFFFCYKT